MNSRQALSLAAALWLASAGGRAQTVVGVGQGGTGASTPAGARAKLGAAAAAHAHTLNELQGITGKSGTGSVLMTFGGGVTTGATCAMFDGDGNLVSSGQPCAVAAQAGGIYTQSFVNATTVTLNHNLGTKNVLLACYDTDDRMVGVHTIRAATPEQAEVTFTTAQSGRCVVQGAGGVEITGAVTSVFGRSGVVTASAGDYSFAMIGGVAGLGQGGTNQTSWTAGRCVQVSADGARLESAGEACGVGVTGESTVVANTGAGAQVLKPATNVTARTLVAGANVLVEQGADTITISVPDVFAGVVLGDGLLGGGTAQDPLRVNPATVPTFYTGSATLNDWGTIGAQSCAQKTFSMPGAVSNDSVIPRWPAGLPADLSGVVYVSASDTIAVRLCNPTAAAVAVANGNMFGATILRSF